MMLSVLNIWSATYAKKKKKKSSNTTYHSRDQQCHSQLETERFRVWFSLAEFLVHTHFDRTILFYNLWGDEGIIILGVL